MAIQLSRKEILLYTTYLGVYDKNALGWTRRTMQITEKRNIAAGILGKLKFCPNSYLTQHLLQHGISASAIRN